MNTHPPVDVALQPPSATTYPRVLETFRADRTRRRHGPAAVAGCGATLALLVAAVPGWAATRHVNLDNPTPAAPYTSWATAATTIQVAIDAAASGDLILVTNGVYQTGARAVYGMSNRVAVNKPVTVRSVNGPEVTIIAGYQVPGTIHGEAAVRCAYLTSGAILSGFTLTNGATQTSRDCDWYTNRSGGGIWCESTNAVATNCVLTGNAAAISGGGTCSGTLTHCTLKDNSAERGGGSYGSTLNHCTLKDNSAIYEGGGAYGSTLYNCTVTGNSALRGGGAASSSLINCTLTDNPAIYEGGGAYGSTVNQCLLVGNSADVGGGASYSGLYHCTLTGNSAFRGGGAAFGSLNNCIVYYNLARLTGDNHYGDSLNPIFLGNCCTTPLPAWGEGNISAQPQFASGSHLSADSPCRGAGDAAYATGLDLDGEPWASPPSMGCDEYWSGSVTGALSVTIVAAYTNVAVGIGVDFQALIGGRVSASRWNFGDGVVVSNRPCATHAWSAPGDYVVELRAYNENHPGGVAASLTIHVVAPPVHYVALNSAAPVPPYTSWTTAATNIQDAVDAAAVPGALVLVSNGVYQTGARAVYGMSNRVAVTKPVTVQSLNGPASSAIQGYGPNGSNAVRCVYLTNGAVLAGFTLTNGATQGWDSSNASLRNQSGGGVWCESVSAVVSNCVLTANSAEYSGGGASGGTLQSCTLSGNWAGGWYGYGGGTSGSTLNNCTLSGNYAYYGGGASAGTLNNCIVYYNSAPSGSNYADSATFNYSCTTPLPDGPGNISSEPQFVDTNLWSNLRLQSSSPCINAGNNADVTAVTDLDGNPRISGGTVDMGTYEFQSPQSMISYAWLQQYGLPIDGSADYVDTDLDAHNNWQEWIAGTIPTNTASVLRLARPVLTATNVTLTWSSAADRFYTLEWATNLGGSSAFSVLQSNLAGGPGTASWTDTKAPTASPRFYRVRVEH